MISQEEIKSFLEGNDPEEHIVAVEFDYVTDSIYKIKEKFYPIISIKIVKERLKFSISYYRDSFNCATRDIFI